jgi:hypothetical protein
LISEELERSGRPLMWLYIGRKCSFPDFSNSLSVNSLRHMWAHRLENGVEEYQALIKFGNRRMVHVPNFNRLLEAKRKNRTN